jgi:hypothetical protein
MAIEEEKDCTYQDVMCVIDSVKMNYEKKGLDLLNNSSIQKIAEIGALL